MKKSGMSAGRSISLKLDERLMRGISFPPVISGGISAGWHSWAKPAALMVSLLLVLGVLAAIFMPVGIDWRETYRPVGIAVLKGQSPFTVDGFRVAPWAALIVVPFAWLPENIGRAAFLLVSLLGFAYVPYKLGARPLALGAYMVSPPVLHCLLNANIDWLPILGFVLPPWIGLFLVIIKPQIGIGVAIYWLLDYLLHKGWLATLRTFAPVSVAILLSFAVFGFWPLRFSEPVGFWWNASLWPASIPVGVALIVAAIRRRRVEFAMPASPCLSPYVLLHSWSGALVALSSLQWEMLGAVAGLWVFVVLRAFSGAL
jgi:hypothetical protein